MKKKKSLSEAFNLFNYTDEMNCGESHDALYKKKSIPISKRGNIYLKEKWGELESYFKALRRLQLNIRRMRCFICSAHIGYFTQGILIRAR